GQELARSAARGREPPLCPPRGDDRLRARRRGFGVLPAAPELGALDGRRRARRRLGRDRARRPRAPPDRPAPPARRRPLPRGRDGRARRPCALRPALRRPLPGGATVRRLSAGYLQAPARQAASLRETAHRPWPLPPGSWRLGQTLEDQLFAHWPVDADALRRLLPGAVRLQTHEGAGWLGVTPFRVGALRLRGTLPLPRVSSFLELNVRTY